MRRFIVGSLIALGASGSGCLSMQSQTSLDATNTAASGAVQPYVEAYVEYAGPQQKWAGPESYILHVTAKDAGAAQIVTTPHLINSEPAIEVTHRTPASQASSVAVAPAIRPMSSMQAREQLAHLATALQGVQAPFHGCMSPVRVRLVRADGALLERQGCRSELGWSRVVSETVSAFVEASLNGVSAGPAEIPVVSPAKSVLEMPARHVEAVAAPKVEAARGVASVPASGPAPVPASVPAATVEHPSTPEHH